MTSGSDETPGADVHEGASPRGFELGLFARNTLWMFVALVGGRLAGLVLFAVLARKLGRDDFGHFVFALSLVPLFFVFGTIGTNTSVVREVARDPSRLGELFLSGLLLRLALGLLTVPVVFAVAVALVDSWAARLAVVLVALARFVDDLSAQYQSVFRALERLRYYAWVDLANRTLSTLLVGIVVFGEGSLVAACVAYLGGSLVALGFAHVTMRRRFPAAVFERPEAGLSPRGLLALATPLGLAAVLNTGVFRIDTVMLQGLRGPAEVAVYGAAYALFEALAGISWTLSSVGLPMMSRARSSGEARQTLEVVNAVLLTILLPLAAVTPFAADAIVDLVFSGRFDEAAGILPVLIGAAVLYVLAQSARVSAVAGGKRLEIVWLAAILLCANVAMNAVVIPRYGFEGAAWTTLATEVLDAALFVGLVHRMHGRLSVGLLRIPAAATAVTVAIVAAAGIRGALAIVVAALVYPVTLLVLARWLAPGAGRGIWRAVSVARER